MEVGEGAGEVEQDVGKLTTASVWAEEDRREGLDGRGRSSCGAAMTAGGTGAASAGERLKQAREGAAELRGEARKVGAH